MQLSGFLVGSTLCFTHAVSLECHFLLGLSVQILTLCSRPSPRPTWMQSLRALTVLPPPFLHRQRAVAFDFTHCLLFQIFSLLDGNILKVRKHSFSYFIFTSLVTSFFVF